MEAGSVSSELKQALALCTHPPSLPQTPIFLGFAAILVIAADAQQLTALQCWASAPPKFPANPEPPAPIPFADLSLAFPHASSPVTFFLYGANRLIKGFL